MAKCKTMPTPAMELLQLCATLGAGDIIKRIKYPLLNCMVLPSAQLPAMRSPRCYLLSHWTLVCYNADVSSHPNRRAVFIISLSINRCYRMWYILFVYVAIPSAQLILCSHFFCPTTCIQLPTLLPPVTLNLSLPQCWRLLSSTQECNRRAVFIISLSINRHYRMSLNQCGHSFSLATCNEVPALLPGLSHWTSVCHIISYRVYR